MLGSAKARIAKGTKTCAAAQTALRTSHSKLHSCWSWLCWPCIGCLSCVLLWKQAESIVGSKDKKATSIWPGSQATESAAAELPIAFHSSIC